MKRIAVVGFASNGQLDTTTAAAVTAATLLGDAVDVLVLGHKCEAAALTAAALEGVARVIQLDASWLDNGLPEAAAVAILSCAEVYSVLLAPTSSLGKDVMPRIAAAMDVTQVSDIVKVVDAETFERPIFAGNAVEVVRVLEPKFVLTIRPSAFAAAGTASSAAPIELSDVPADPGLSSFEGAELLDSTRPDLSGARVVISGGRGFGSKENFDRLLNPLADRLGAAIGASRAAVDAGFAGNELQVGQTGRIVAPELYIAVGISGAIQHLAGMKDAKVIVAINNDADAPIHQIATYSLVGDLFEVLPQIEQQLN